MIAPDETALASDFTGLIVMWSTPIAPDGWLLCNGQAVSRATYADLFPKVAPSATITVTIASPGVVTWTGHEFQNGDKIVFTTTGALPTGITAGVPYYVVNRATNTFQISLTRGGTAINTSGSQSGVHTGRFANHGLGDGSTTFNLPDFCGRAPIGPGANTFALDFVPADVDTTGNTIAVPWNETLYTGTKVRLATTGGLPSPLATSTDYYVIRISATSIKLATSRQNALGSSSTTGASSTPVPIDITTQGTGVHTLTVQDLSTRRIGDKVGEETHTETIEEQVAHAHTHSSGDFDGPTGESENSDNPDYSASTGSTGGSQPANNMSPSFGINFIIKT